MTQPQFDPLAPVRENRMPKVGAGTPPSISALPPVNPQLPRVSSFEESVNALGSADLQAQQEGKSGAFFNIMRYPLELGTDEHPHYVMFYVQVRQSDISKAEASRSLEVASIDYSQQNRPTMESGAQKGVAIYATLRAAQETTKAVAEAIVGRKDAITQSAAGIAGTVGGVAAVASGFADTLVGERTKIILKDAIALYLNGVPKVQYHASWYNEDLGTLAGGGGKIAQQLYEETKETGTKVVDNLKGMKFGKAWNELMEGGSDVLNILSRGGGNAARAMVLKGADKAKNAILGNFGAALKASAAVTENPFKAALFNSMGYRQFAFEYTFLPKNAAEYKEVQKIIHTFKKYMHPILGADKFIMYYPAEWNIAYYYKTATNDQLFKLANCALVDVAVSYGGTDFTTFKRLPGAPTEITLGLQFVELELLTQGRIDQGF